MQHVPALLNEVLGVIMPRDGGLYFDGTVGGGGHTRAILEKSAPSGQLAGTDLDGGTIAMLSDSLAHYGDRIHLYNTNFSEIDKIRMILGWDYFDGILLDLGMSSWALDDADRGFSFMREGPLDMRFSLRDELDAYQVVNTYEEDQLKDIIRTYGEERFASRIARHIVQSRPLKTTSDLVEVVRSSVPKRFWPQKIHVATKTFQAIRMEVNKEIENLKTFLPKASSALSTGGVLAVISYHSIEDRIVKRFFSGTEEENYFLRGLPRPSSPDTPKLVKIPGKPIGPSPLEIQANPRSRSARLRAAMRVQ
ncbi:MAG TPA: 16S rRNA (cytosine(1402)-N(4))-methyltransferase RsmH [Deltaproteobacteria bacterium]|nr:16S rRNA (cytosine(1402)-N(4))-methyltransferase RsmH [Deltaproteobacteria bacterium]